MRSSTSVGTLFAVIPGLMEKRKNYLQELWTLGQRGKQVWPFVEREDRLSLGAATILVGIASAANTAVALLLGQLVDRIEVGSQSNFSPMQMYQAAGWVLSGLAAVYVGREAINLVRRIIVERSVTRLNRDMQLKVVGHVIRGDLSSLGTERIGTCTAKFFAASMA